MPTHMPSFARAPFALRVAAGGLLLLLSGCHGATQEAASASTAAAAVPTVAGRASDPAPSTAAKSAPGGDPAARMGELTNPDDATMVFLYYDLAGIPPPIDDWTEQDGRVQYAPGAEKAARRAEVRASLEAGVRAVRGVGILHLSMHANLSDYDPSYGEFTVGALSPSSELAFQALGQKVTLRFDNGLDAQSWRVPANQAQAMRDRIDQHDVGLEVTAKIDKVLPGPRGGTLVARVQRYELRESNGGAVLAKVELPRQP